jgi:hypothetical protein
MSSSETRGFFSEAVFKNIEYHTIPPPENMEIQEQKLSVVVVKLLSFPFFLEVESKGECLKDPQKISKFVMVVKPSFCVCRKYKYGAFNRLYPSSNVLLLFLWQRRQKGFLSSFWIFLAKDTTAIEWTT